jgi:iron complex outermembrane receptor protein
MQAETSKGRIGHGRRAPMLALAGWSCLLGTAWAQQGTGETDKPADVIELNKIVVTAQKREQQVADVPISISAYSGQFMRSFGITELDQLARYVPGLQVQIQSPNNPGIAVRGITTDDGSATTTSRVSIFQDGVDISRSRGSVVAFYDMDRIEVLRGPQGTLFGRGAESGAISLIQNKARNITEGGFTSEFGNFGSRMLTGYANAPLSESVFGRLAVYDAEHDGYIKNLSGGRLNGQDTKAIRASLHVATGAQSGIDLIANYQRDSPPGTDFRSLLPNRHGSTDIFGAADLNRGDQLGLRRKVYGLTALGDFKLNDSWRLASTTGLRRFDSVEQFDADGSQVDMLNFAEHAKSKQLSQELRLNYDDGGRFTGFVGANYFYETGSQGVPVTLDERSLLLQLLRIAPSISPAAVPLLSLLGPVPPLLTPNFLPNQPYTTVPLLGLPLNPAEQERYRNQAATRSYELFGDGTVHVTDRFDLTGGLRVSRERQTAGYRVDVVNPGGIGTALALLGIGLNGITAPNDLFMPTPGTLTNRHSSTSVVGRLIGSYRFSDELNSYVSLSRGRRPNVLTFNVAPSGLGYERGVLPAEILWNLEAGVKGNANDGRFSYDLSAFYYRYDNFQSQVFDNARYITVNSGRARAPGLEASLQQVFTPQISGFFNYSYLHARFADTDSHGNRQLYAGNALRLAPDHTVALGLLWNVPLAEGRTFYFRPSYTWRSKSFFEDSNNPAYAQKAYGLLSLRTGISFDQGRWDVGLWGSNLTGRKFLVDAGNTGQTFGLPTFVPGAPRTYGVSLSGRF